MEQTETATKPFVGKPWRIALLVTSLVVGAIATVAIVNPSETSLLPSCIFHSVTGLHCPGCGSTRALHALVHGEISAAFRLNPILFTGVPLIAVLALIQLRIRYSNQQLNYVASVMIATIVLGYFAARNIPTPSTSPLRPIDYRTDSPLLDPQ